MKQNKQAKKSAAPFTFTYVRASELGSNAAEASRAMRDVRINLDHPDVKKVLEAMKDRNRAKAFLAVALTTQCERAPCSPEQLAMTVSHLATPKKLTLGYLRDVVQRIKSAPN